MSGTKNLAIDMHSVRAREDIVTIWCSDPQLSRARQESVLRLCRAGVDFDTATDMVDALLVASTPVVVGALLEDAPARGRSFASLGEMLWVEESEEFERALTADEIDRALTEVSSETALARPARRAEASLTEILSFE